MYEASVIVTAGKRAGSLRQAVAAVLRTPWVTCIEVVVVTEPDSDDDARPLSQLAHAPHVIRIIPNQFAPGPMGARHTGILAASSAVIAFCDDGEAWEHGRTRLAGAYNAQIPPMRAH